MNKLTKIVITLIVVSIIVTVLNTYGIYNNDVDEPTHYISPFSATVVVACSLAVMVLMFIYTKVKKHEKEI